MGNNTVSTVVARFIFVDKHVMSPIWIELRWVCGEDVGDQIFFFKKVGKASVGVGWYTSDGQAYFVGRVAERAEVSYSRLEGSGFIFHKVLFFFLGFLSRTFTIHRTAGEGGVHFFNSSLPFHSLLRHTDIR